MSCAIVWFRGDLRLADNPALSAACAEHSQVLPLYIHSPQEAAPWRPGAASRWWLHHSLAALNERFHAKGGSLHIRHGDALSVLRQLAQATRAEAVYWNRQYEPAAIARDTRIKEALRLEGIHVHSKPGNLWREPWQVATKVGEPYRVFTPFWRSLRTDLDGSPPLPVAQAAQWLRLDGGLPLSALELLPRIRWDTGFGQLWKPGESGANELLEVFCDDALSSYAKARDLPARHGTSRLSPHLHFGEITPRQIRAALLRHADRRDSRNRPDPEPYLRELGWREFAHHLLYHFPTSTQEDFNPNFAGLRWAEIGEDQLARWQSGRTGVPLVDAGMRELWHTGWMHNRVRMVAASFLTKNLRVHWQSGARWFWDTLVDADLANNTLGWQWVAGTGADAAPYFRIFNPVTQSQKFDPDGVYLRRWLPELADVPTRVLHEPWADPACLRRTGYPSPMVDLAASRQAALAAYSELRRVREVPD
ncbi:MAG: deoxyribodipyrimidine photo-lyase [Proteobacteria bacterium]|uniref:cryptochrome/photolyase family protein n=1 Tax=Rudaea sp. TaxID=2136325 RepID=UPI0032206702|nr:deoxyribodipyrimidine photo-lyase [Pseudomonadota bacterium]